MTRVDRGRGWAMHLGDCRDALPTIGDVDHAIFDAPYEEEAHTKARRALCDSTRKNGARNTGKVRRIDQPLEIDFAAITADERYAVSKLIAAITKRWVIGFCQIEGIAAWRTAYEAAGLQWVRGGVWRKPNGAPCFLGDRPGQGFECLAIAHPKGKKRWNGGGRHAFWQFPLEHGTGNGQRNEHTTQKPLALMRALVADFTEPGEIVVDPYAGSGTTGVACLRLDRVFIGIEKQEKYFDLACERLRAEERDTTVAADRAGQSTLFGGRS